MLALDRIRVSLVLAMAIVLIAPIAYMSMFTTFHAYDDEGYFLQLLRDYLSGHPLLNPAVPVYGPFFFETMGGLFKLLGVAPGHDSGRFVTVAVWLIASLLIGVTAWRLTRSLWLGLGAELVTFHVLAALTNEPMSPSALVSLLLVGLAATAVFSSTRPRLAATLIGGIVAALCLIKINVGVFAAVAVLFAWTAGLADRWRHVLLPVMALVITGLPIALMVTLFSQAWVVEFAIGAALSAAAVGVVCIASRPATPSPDLRWVIAGGAVVTVVCVGIALLGGTTLSDLWNGLVIFSLHFPSIFTFPLEINPAVDVVAALSLLAAVLVRKRFSPAARIAVGLAVWVSVLLLPASVFLFTLPFVWVAAAAPPVAADEQVGTHVRVFLPTLAVLSILQVYPVAGTQMSVAATMQLLVGAMCIRDGILQSRTAAWTAPAAMVIGAAFVGLSAFFAGAAFAGESPLGLPGAEAVRVPADQATQLRALTAAIDRSCTEFITYPGMNSFYLWTNQSPPTDVRSEVWMITLDQNHQQALVDQLAAKPRLCVVKDQGQIDFWAGGRQIPQLPLVQFIKQDFVVTGTYGAYVLLIRSSH